MSCLNAITRHILTGSVIILIVAIASAQASNVDLSFAPVPEKDAAGTATSFVLQPDDKILVFGSFQIVNGSLSRGVARLNPDGSPDPTFQCTVCDFAVEGVLVQPDGKILVGASSLPTPLLLRLNADGSRDESFDSSLPTGNFPPETVSVMPLSMQPNGGIVVLLKRRPIVTPNRMSDDVYRVSPNGSVDAGFSPITLGSVSTLGTTRQEPGPVATTADNRIFAASNWRFSGPQPTGTGVLKRYLQNGTVDPSFESVTVQFLNPPPLTTVFGTILDLDQLEDGSLLIAGSIDTVNGLPRKGAARIAPAGNVDPSFNHTEISEFISIRQLSNGKIMVRTATRSYRLEADGTIDPTFQSTEFATIRAWHLDSTERVVFKTDTAFYRLDHDGTVLDTFQVVFGVPASITAATVQSDGYVVMAGDFVRVNGVVRPSVARLDTEGRVDPTFNPGTGFSSTVTRLITQQDDKVIAIGSFLSYNGTSRRAIARINTDGSLDSSFTPAIPAGVINTIVRQGDGRVLIGGTFTSVNGVTRNGIARLEPNGELDSAFDPLFGSPTIQAIAVEPSGKIMVGGTFSGVNGFNRNNIVRLNSDGSTDASFNAQGLNTVRRIAVAPDGRYVVFTTQLSRLSTNGLPDTGFTPPELVSGSTINAILYKQDGTIVVGGAFTTSGPLTRMNFMRLRPNGDIDQTFLPPGTDAVVRTVARAADDRLIVGGDFNYIGGVYRPSIARVIVSSLTFRTLFDFDGDGRSDYAVFRPSNGYWYELLSQDSSFYALQFGQQGDRIAPGDYDGDGKTDVGVFRDTVPGAGTLGYFYIINSADGSITIAQFGSTGDLPVSGDWDGDGKADLAVYRAGAQSAFYYRPSGSPGVDFRQIVWGTAGDKPLVGDFDGDGKLDAAVFRPSNTHWYILRSSDNQFTQLQFGISTDIPLAADFDGNGMTDIAVYRSSTGAWYTSTNPQTNYGYVQFGTAEDLPVPADYDGDGRADVAVFRPSTGTWYLLRSTAGFTGIQFGASNDKPIPNAFVP